MQRISEDEAGRAALLATQGDHIMHVLLGIFRLHGAAVHQEAMLTVGVFCSNVCGAAFAKYLPDFLPILQVGIQSYQEREVCLASLGVLNDLAAALNGAMVPITGDLLSGCLLPLISRPDAHRDIKPAILMAFGYLALACEHHFAAFCAPVTKVLREASHASIQMSRQPNLDEEQLDFNNQLRSGILYAYTGLALGLGGAVAQVLTPELGQVVELAHAIGQDIEQDARAVEPEVAVEAVCLLADLADKLPNFAGALASKQDSKVGTVLEHVAGLCAAQPERYGKKVGQQLQKLDGMTGM